MNKSETIAKLAVALIGAQSEFKPVGLNSVNPYYNSKYADLGAVIEATRAILTKHGLSVSQLTEGVNGEAGVTTILMHESGEWISSMVVVPIEGKNISQEAGKSITYLRRYALSSILGIFADEDTDGEKKSLVETAKQTFPDAVVKTSMTVAEAESQMTEEGQPYGKLPIGELTIRFNSLSKAKKSNPETFTEEKRKKMEACKILIAEKSKHSEVE